MMEFEVKAAVPGIYQVSANHKGPPRTLNIDGKGALYLDGSEDKAEVARFIVDYALLSKKEPPTADDIYNGLRTVFGETPKPDDYEELFVSRMDGVWVIYQGSKYYRLSNHEIKSTSFKESGLKDELKKMLEGSDDHFAKALLHYIDNPPNDGLDFYGGGGSNGSSFAKKAGRLPGLSYRLPCPKCMSPNPKPSSLRQIIIHLNDQHKLPRNEIADWLESIHDPTGENGPNLNFGVVNETA